MSPSSNRDVGLPVKQVSSDWEAEDARADRMLLSSTEETNGPCPVVAIGVGR